MWAERVKEEAKALRETMREEEGRSRKRSESESLSFDEKLRVAERQSNVRKRELEEWVNEGGS